MRLPGYCTDCHRTRNITVRRINPTAKIQTGICHQCEDEREGKRRR